MSKVIVIGGQTASGKSDLAVCVALLLKQHGVNSEIISADSRQVYIGGDKISAKITDEEMQGIPHHMLNVSNMKKDYNVADYKKSATKIIKDLHKKNIIPIICGGTGLYIDNLIYKKTIPEVLPNPELREKLEKLSCDELFKILKVKDPARAQNIDTKNKRRLIRALEIIEELGFVPEEEKPELLYKTLFIGLTLPKELLAERIVKRTNARMKLGMQQEIIDLHDSGISYDRLQSFGMEYKWLSLYAQKLVSKTDCTAGINKDTIAYAKRQMTWFKKNKDVVWLDMSNPKESTKIAEELVLNFIK